MYFYKLMQITLVLNILILINCQIYFCNKYVRMTGIHIHDLHKVKYNLEKIEDSDFTVYGKLKVTFISENEQTFSLDVRPGMPESFYLTICSYLGYDNFHFWGETCKNSKSMRVKLS